MVAAVYYSSRQPLGAPPPTIAPPSFGAAAANFLAVHGNRRSINVNGLPFHTICPPTNIGSGKVPVAGGYGQLPTHQPMSNGMTGAASWNQVRVPCDVLSRSTPSNGLTPVQQLRSVPACKTPQPPHQPCVQQNFGGATTPVTPLRSSRDQLSASQRPYTSRALRPQSPSSACSGGRAVSPRVVHSGHFVWPPSVQAPSGSPLTPTRARNRDVTERHVQVAPSAKTVVKVQTCENAPPIQAKGRTPLDGTPKQGKAAQSPFPQREVLRERNEQTTPTTVGRSPLVAPAERSPVGNVSCSELPPETSTKHAWQDVYLAANASPPAVAVSTSAGPKQTPAVPEELQIVPRDLAPEVSDVTPSLNFSLTNAHPMVTPEEKTFILSCLEAFSEAVEREGGFKQYALKDICETREDLIGALQEDGEQSLTPQELLRRSLESTLRNTVRNGHESVTVLLGAPYSMGMKKVVKAEVKCEDTGLHRVMSIYWDWDVKLEQRSGQN